MKFISSACFSGHRRPAFFCLTDLEDFFFLRKKKYLILQSQKKGGRSVNGEVIAGGDECLLNISLINVDVSYVISATKIESITF